MLLPNWIQSSIISSKRDNVYHFKNQTLDGASVYEGSTKAAVPGRFSVKARHKLPSQTHMIRVIRNVNKMSRNGEFWRFCQLFDGKAFAKNR